MVDLLREAPLKWFTFAHGILGYLSRIDDIRITLKTAKARAQTKKVSHPFFARQIHPTDRFAQGIGKAIFAAKDRVSIERRKAAVLNLTRLDRLGWKESVSTATKVISLGDVIDGNHGRAFASRRASRTLDQIARMATCLYLRFSEVLPSIRLDWAERLSQFDSPVNLRNLYALPRWGEIDFIERHEIQTLVDWLYKRVDVKQSEAVAIISDLIRVCILLASHAPVRKIIAGHIPRPTVVSVGSKVDIAIDLTRVRIGMNVIIQSSGKVLAHGVIDDIVAGQASARIVKAMTKSVSLETGTKVQVGEPRAFGKKFSGARLFR